MYDRPETAAVNDRLWDAIRSRLTASDDVPQALIRDGETWEHWLNPDLLLSQTCGYPYRARLHGHVTLVAAPVWDLPCPPGHYFSVLVVRADDSRTDLADFAAARLAYNDALSQSGWAAPQNFARAHGFHFTDLYRSGSHRDSSRAVAEGRADIAALDAATWHLIRQFDPWADRLRVLARTPPTPALPFISSARHNAAELYAALSSAVAALAPEDKAVLGLRGVTALTPAAYLAVPNPPDPEAIGGFRG